MKYYSEKLNKLFITEKELLTAEAEHEQKIAEEKAQKQKAAEERKIRASEVENAKAEMDAATKKYHELLDSFIKDFGSYHTTIKTCDNVNQDILVAQFLNDLFNLNNFQ